MHASALPSLERASHRFPPVVGGSSPVWRARFPLEVPAVSDLDVRELGLLDFVERGSGGRMHAPTHLAPMVDVLERARRLEDVRAVVAAPVQHGKTSAGMKACA